MSYRILFIHEPSFKTHQYNIDTLKVGVVHVYVH